MQHTRRKLLENFDEEVARKLRDGQTKIKDRLDHLEYCLWGLTKLELGNAAVFDDANYRFNITGKLVGIEPARPGEYGLLVRDHSDDAHPYRPGSPLAEALIDRAKSRVLPPAVVSFDYGAFEGRIAMLEPFRGHGGWLTLSSMEITSLESEDRLLWSVVSDDGNPLHPDFADRIFRLPGSLGDQVGVPASVAAELERQGKVLRKEVEDEIQAANTRFYDEETDKLERWADDKKHGLEIMLKDLDGQIKQAKKDAKNSADLASKIELQRTIRALESERMKRRKELFDSQDDIDAQRERLIGDVEAKLKQAIEVTKLITIRWHLK
jgi:adenine-specific DNA-methyltransferase